MFDSSVLFAIIFSALTVAVRNSYRSIGSPLCDAAQGLKPVMCGTELSMASHARIPKVPAGRLL
jgi:hypothetical protein